MGRAARSPCSLLSMPLRRRDSEWWGATQTLAAMVPIRSQRRWRHPSRNFTRELDAVLAAHDGPAWKAFALDRSSLRAGEHRWLQWLSSTYGCPAPSHQGRNRVASVAGEDAPRRARRAA